MLLLEAKDLVDRGDWLTWLEANCHVGVRQAQTFMRLARNRHRLEAIKNESAAYLSIAAAEALVGRPRPERPHDLPGQLDLLGGPEVSLSTGDALGVVMSEARMDEKRLVYGIRMDQAREETHREIAKLYEKLAEKELDARSFYTGTKNTKPRRDSAAMIECERHYCIAEQYEARALRRLKKLTQLSGDPVPWVTLGDYELWKAKERREPSK